LADQKYLFRRNSGKQEPAGNIEHAKYKLPVRKMNSVQVESVFEESVLKEDEATAKLDLFQKIPHQEEGLILSRKEQRERFRQRQAKRAKAKDRAESKSQREAILPRNLSFSA
jgi:hypothetical protein